MDPLALAISLLAALAVLLISITVLGWRSAGDVDERIQRYGTGKVDEEQAARPPRPNIGEILSSSDTLSAFNRAVERRDFGTNVARDLARADVSLRVSEYLLLWAAIAIGLPLVFVALSPILPGLRQPLVLLAGLAIGFLLPRLWLHRRQTARLNAFNRQLPDTIVLISNALRAGSSFLQACDLVTREDDPPMSLEFGRVVREVNLGLPLEAALANMVRRVRSEDLDLMTTAINIQYSVGGNLAEILDMIAHTIRERVRLQGEIATLTAQQRLSGYIVAFLPIGLLGFLFVVTPNFLAPMFRKPPEVAGIPAGVVLLVGAGLSMLAGFLIIRRIVDIDY